MDWNLTFQSRKKNEFSCSYVQYCFLTLWVFFHLWPWIFGDEMRFNFKSPNVQFDPTHASGLNVLSFLTINIISTRKISMSFLVVSHYFIWHTILHFHREFSFITFVKRINIVFNVIVSQTSISVWVFWLIKNTEFVSDSSSGWARRILLGSIWITANIDFTKLTNLKWSLPKCYCSISFLTFLNVVFRQWVLCGELKDIISSPVLW